MEGTITALPPRYQLRRILGQGGMGRVVLAWDRELERPVALKQVLHELGSETLQARFLHEARLLAQLEHPRVVRLLDVGTHQGRPYFSMEVLEGESLAARHPLGGMTPDAAGALFDSILEALGAVHQAGMLHRDLSSHNVFLDDHRGPVLIDFGLARSEAGGPGFTATGSVVGSPATMAPEVFAHGSYGPASDLFAAARVTFDALSPVDIFTGLPRPCRFDLKDALSSLQSGSYLDVARRVLAPHGELGQLLLEALDRDPARRPADLDRLRARLEVARASLSGPGARTQAMPPLGSPGTRVLPAPPSPTPGPPAPPRGSPWGAATALILVGFALGTLTSRRPSPPPPLAGHPAPAAAPGAPASPPPPEVPRLPGLTPSRAEPTLQRLLPIQLLDPQQEALARLAAAGGDAAAEARTLLATGSTRILGAQAGFHTPLEIFPAGGSLDDWMLYYRVVHDSGMTRVQGDRDGAEALLRWLPEAMRPARSPPPGTRVFAADLTGRGGLWAREHQEDQGLKWIRSGGRLQTRIRVDLEVDGMARAQRAWLVVQAPDLDAEVLLRVQVNDVTPGSALGGGFHLLTPSGEAGVASHQVPLWAVRDGPNHFQLELRAYRDLGRTLDTLTRLEVHLSP